MFQQSLALLTDFYQLTMAHGYWKLGLQDKEAVFHHFFRRPPFQGGFTIAAGLQVLVDFLESFRYEESDLAYLSTILNEKGEPLFERGFLDYLANFSFSCDIDAMPEGTVAFPYEPLVRVKGPLIQAQLLESPLLNIMNFSTLIATKAARISIAAEGDKVLEFGLRRAQGIDGALTASRAAFIGGCHSTSNVLAGKLLGIPVSGTQAHSWIMVFDSEEEAFMEYAKSLSHNPIFLVDTYDTIEGVSKAIEVAKKLEKDGRKFAGIRLDSGDLAELSIKARHMLDQAGFASAVIVASNELDESLISELKRQGAQIAVWGVGTNLVTAKGQGALDGVYKLSALRDPKGEGVGGEWQYKIKLSEQMIKVSNPGILQVRRYSNASQSLADVIYDERIGIASSGAVVDPLDPTKQRILRTDLNEKELLQPIYRKGKLVYTLPALTEIRDRTALELQSFSTGIKRFINPHSYNVGMEKQLYDLKVQLIQSLRKKNHLA